MTSLDNEKQQAYGRMVSRKIALFCDQKHLLDIRCIILVKFILNMCLQCLSSIEICRTTIIFVLIFASIISQQYCPGIVLFSFAGVIGSSNGTPHTFIFLHYWRQDSEHYEPRCALSLLLLFICCLSSSSVKVNLGDDLMYFLSF